MFILIFSLLTYLLLYLFVRIRMKILHIAEIYLHIIHNLLDEIF